MEINEIVRKHFDENSPAEQIEALNRTMFAFLESNNKDDGYYTEDYLCRTVQNVASVSEFIVRLYEADLIDERYKGRSVEFP